MSVYLIGQMTIHDRQEYAKYEAAFVAMFHGYRGEVIIVDEDARVLEGAWPATRTAVLRFDDEAETIRWYKSVEYQEAMKFRLRSASTNLILAKGLSTDT
jgi:uncharacterized protein (DUF1330 family)